MKIGCLGWGSLVWNPGDLPVTQWNVDGPVLPVEFARQSKDGRLTLVLLKQGKGVPVLYGELRASKIEQAIFALAQREGCPNNRIGVWETNAPEEFVLHADAIGIWAKQKGLDAVVWTALAPRFGGVDARVPTCQEALEYLRELTPEAKRKAEEYVRRAPTQIRTPYREAFEREFAWRPLA